jgi:hypothetical protein
MSTSVCGCGDDNSGHQFECTLNEFGSAPFMRRRNDATIHSESAGIVKQLLRVAAGNSAGLQLELSARER